MALKKAVRPLDTVYCLGRIQKNPFIPGGVNKRLLQKEIRQKTIIPVERLPAVKKSLQSKGYNTKGLVFYPRRLPNEEHNIHMRSVFTEPSTKKEKSFVFKGASGKIEVRRSESIAERMFWGGARKPTTNHAIFVAKKLLSEYKKARAERDPVILWALKHGIRKPPFLEPIATIKPHQLPFHLPGKTPAQKIGRQDFVRKHGKHLLEEEKRMLFEKEIFSGRKSKQTIVKLAKGSEIHGIPARIRREEIVFNYAVPLNTRVVELGYAGMLGYAGVDPFDPKLQNLFRYFGFSLGKGGACTAKRYYSLESASAKILEKFAANLAVSTHIIQNRLGGTTSSKHGQVYDMHNVTATGHIVDYDVIGFNEKASVRKIDNERDFARNMIEEMRSKLSLPHGYSQGAVDLYNKLLKLGEKFVRESGKRKPSWMS